jgi:arylsulfatase A-like enzyme
MFPEQLKGEGYETFITGKWHNGERLVNRAFSTGANIFFGGMADHLATPVSPYDPTGKYPPSMRAKGAKFSTELFSDSAIEFIEKADRAKPWLCYVAYTSPHDPRMAPKAFGDLYPPGNIKVPANFAPEHPFDNGDMKIRDEALAPWPRTPRIVQEHRAAYYAMITHLDAQIGRVLEALERSGQAGNTIVVFTADNGLAVGQHGLLGKQNMYEHSMRVPLVIAGPGLPRGKRSDAFAYLLDLYPTLCDLTGTKAAATVEGKSLAPILRGQQKTVRDSMFHAYRHFQRAVKDDRWKLILHNVNGKLTTQLFDLRNDPLERQNLAEKEPARVKALTERLKQWMKETDDPVKLDEPNWGNAS